MSLHQRLRAAVERRGGHPAVEEESGASLTFRELDALSAGVRDRLVALGVRPGDRVGVSLPKSIDAVAAIFGVLRSGAAYVTLDATAPVSRASFVLADCGVAAVVLEEQRVEALGSAMAELGARPRLLALSSVGGGAGLEQCLRAAPAAARGDDHPSRPGDLAYILYTSGSTGRPKGVMLSHHNALSFVDWCVRTFAPRAEDRFSSHAPFHFDLSILDLYTPLEQGSTLVLVSEATGKEPARLAEFISDARISIWYSVPSILGLMAQYGGMEGRDYSRLRTVIFAGEVFPVTHLRTLAQRLPHCTYHNLYGPTETNVCTAYQVPLPIPAERTRPYPIGRVCDNLHGVIVDPEGGPVAAGTEGELCIAGPNVMLGYWNREEQTRNAFLERDGRRWYRTGDLVVEQPDGELAYVGRRDRMVKKRGFRIELGEIEACLYRHPGVAEAAVIALQHPVDGVQVRSHLVTRNGERLSIIDLKRFCSEHLPGYMIPDKFRFHESLPRTSTDKVDYESLQRAE